MKAVERTTKDHISLNRHKTVDRSLFPPHWGDAFIQDLGLQPGWTRYLPPRSHPSLPIGMLEEWHLWHGALIKALDILLYHDDEANHVDAVNGIRRAIQLMDEDLDDILIFMRKTEGNWQEPTPSENLMPVEVVS